MNDSKMRFLDPKNEKVQKLLGWLPIGLAGFAVYTWVLPWLLGIAIMSMKLLAIGSVITLLGMFLFNEKWRWSVGFAVQRVVDLFASFLVKNDPIGVMKYRLKEMRRMYQEFESAVADLRGSVEKAERDREVYQTEFDRAQGRMTSFQRKGATAPAVQTAANQMLRRERSIANIDKEIEQGKAMIALLVRYLEQSQYYIEDVSDTIIHTERERKRLKTSSSAFEKARKILKGNTTSSDMYDEALETANEQAAMMIGEMKQFISGSHGALEAFEADQDGAIEMAYAQLERQRTGSKMLSYQPGLPLNLPEEAAAVPVLARSRAKDDIDRFLNS